MVDNIGSSSANQITVQDDMVIGSGKSLSVAGNFYVGGFYGRKPYVALLVASNGFITSNVGYVASEQITITQASSGAYTIAFPTHPNQANYLVHAQYRTTSASQTLYVATCNNSSAQITVWLRHHSTNAIVSGNFYVHTVP